jgi:hypothetical protein
MEYQFCNFKSFLDAVESIISVELQKAKKILKTTGRDIENIDDIFINSNGELFDLLPDGTLVRVNLYIATHSVVDAKALYNLKIENLYKYHIYQCSTVSNMFASGRKHRYKLNNRDNGTFFYTFTNFRGKILKQEPNQKLNICKNCLKKFLKLNNRYPTDREVREFNLKELYTQKQNFFDFDVSSLEKGEYAKANVYVKNWNKISTKIKEKREYTCQDCGFRPKDSYQKRFIHTHHINGDKQNNFEDNLRVLCIKCHSQVDEFHTRIKSNKDYKEFIEIISSN